MSTGLASNTIAISFSAVIIDAMQTANQAMLLYAGASYYNSTEFWIGSQEFDYAASATYDVVIFSSQNKI